MVPVCDKWNRLFVNAMNKMVKPSFIMILAVMGAAVMFFVLFANRCSNSSSGEKITSIVLVNCELSY